MKSLGWCLSLSLALMLVSVVLAQAPKSEPAQAEADVRAVLSGEPLKEDPKDDELRKLLKARYNEVLSEEGGFAAMHRRDWASAESLAETRQRRLQAGLDLCDRPADKIALLNQFVEQTKDQEKLAQAMKEAARGTQMTIHRFRYQRFDAEIQRLRAQREIDKANSK